jgi:predicted metal-dependent RNase
MIVLEDLMDRGTVPQVPIYLDGMIMEATAIHTAYPEYLTKSLRDKIFQEGENPLLSDIFTLVDSHERRKEIIASDQPMIVIATAGMMNGGPVLEYFKNWAEQDRHSLVFVGFQAGGTLGRRIQQGRREITMSDDQGKSKVVNVNLDVESVDGFSGHSDRRQLMNYVKNLNPRPNKVITMHGDEDSCRDLASGIHKEYNLKTWAPKNLETFRLK